MLGCAGSDGSIAAVSFDFATDEGRVSGSKSAFKIRASFADRLVFGTSTAMVFKLWVIVVLGDGLENCWCKWRGFLTLEYHLKAFGDLFLLSEDSFDISMRGCTCDVHSAQRPKAASHGKVPDLRRCTPTQRKLTIQRRTLQLLSLRESKA